MKLRIFFSLGFLTTCGLLFLFASMSQASNRELQEGRICLYSDTNYRGQSTCLNAGESVTDLKRRGWNDKVSSIRVYGQTRAIIYGDTNYRGGSIDLSSDIPNLKAQGWNDRISSVQVISDYTGRGDGWRDDYRDNRRDDYRDNRRGDYRGNRDERICLYSDTNYRGRSTCLNAGESITDLKRRGWNDKVSSIRIFGGAKAIIYVDTNYRGRSNDISSDIPNLKRQGWNDRISSIQVVSDYSSRGDWRGSDDPWRDNRGQDGRRP